MKIHDGSVRISGRVVTAGVVKFLDREVVTGSSNIWYVSFWSDDNSCVELFDLVYFGPMNIIDSFASFLMKNDEVMSPW